MRVIQISDAHVTREGRRAYRVVDTAHKLAELCRRAAARLGLEEARRRKPGGRSAPPQVDAIVVTGDLVQMGRSEEYERFRAAMGPLDRLRRPILVLPGNHDRRETMRAAFRDHAYLPTEGPLNHAHHLASSAWLLCLDTLVEGRLHGALSADTLAWTRERLAEAAGAPMLVALHHPPGRTGLPGIDRRPTLGGPDLLQMLRAYRGPLRVIAGHTHRRMLLRRGGVATCIAPTPFAAELRTRPRPTDGPDAPKRYAPTRGGYMDHRWRAGSGFRSRFIPDGPLTAPLPRFG